MSFTVKDIINEAFDRSGIYPNPTDALPGEYFSMGLKALQGLVSHYNTRNYIMSTQRMVELKIPASGCIKLGKTEEGVEPAIEDVAAISTVYWKQSETVNKRLNFVSFMNFPGYMPGNYIYSWNQTGEYQFDLIFQKWMAGKDVTVVYNVPFECQKNTVYYLPLEYKELFVLGLILKLLAIYPREDKTMYEQILEELKSVTGAIEAKQADSKVMEWNTHDYVSKQAAFESGSFLGV